MRLSRLLPLAILLTACGKGHFNGAPKTGGDTLVYPLMSKSTTLDPGKINDIYMAELLQNVAEPLVMYSEQNEIVPCLAEKWEVTDGGRTYIFHLRKGVKFTNGRPVVADDFRWSWERALAKEFGSPSAGDYLGSIQGVPDYVAGKVKSIAGVKAVDDTTLQVTLDKPRPYFLGNLTVPQTAVLAKEAAGPGEIRDAKSLVGTGPFFLAKYLPDQEFVLDANPDYWGGRAKIAHIRRPIVISPTARLDSFRAGEFDYLELSRVEAVTLNKATTERGRLRFVPKATLEFITLGEKAYPPFQDARVRKAFAMAFDRGHLVRDLLTGSSEARGLVPHGVPGYQKDYQGLAFDPAAARTLLAQAGYPEGKGLPVVEFDYAAETARVTVESFAADMQKNLQVRVKPRLLEWTAFLEKQVRGTLQIGFSTWTADYLDPQNFISLQLATFGRDKEGYKDAKFDDLCRRADVESNPERRADLYRQAERYAIEQAARLPVVMTNLPTMTSPRLKGLRLNALGPMPMTKVELGGEEAAPESGGP